jgi:hypothetical protein
MTTQSEEDGSPIWFFTTKDNALVQKLGSRARAIATFASLLRLDPEHAEIWLNESSVFTGVKVLFGPTPRRNTPRTSGRLVELI